MNIYYFEITNERMSTTVAIFANNAESASAISGRLMHNIEHLQPRYNGGGLTLFRQSGKPKELSDALGTAKWEGLAGYTLEDGWTVLEV